MTWYWINNMLFKAVPCISLIHYSCMYTLSAQPYCNTRVEMLTSHAVDKLVLCLIGWEVLNLWPPHLGSSSAVCQGISETLSAGRGTSWGVQKTGATRGCSLCLPNRNSRGSVPRVRRKVLKKVSISWNFSRIFRPFCCVCWLCVSLRVCVRERFPGLYTHYSRHKTELVFIFTVWPLMMTFCQVNTLVGEGINGN